jgi:hypothetical protein
MQLSEDEWKVLKYLGLHQGREADELFHAFRREQAAGLGLLRRWLFPGRYCLTAGSFDGLLRSLERKGLVRVVEKIRCTDREYRNVPCYTLTEQGLQASRRR